MKRILVIDDNLIIRDALCEMLEQAGYVTVGISNGRTAAQVHEEQPVDLLITDIFMPETDGLEVIYKFRNEFPNVNIIAVSGGGSRGMVELLTVAKKMGAQKAFMKPFEWSEILSAVRELLNDGNRLDC